MPDDTRDSRCFNRSMRIAARHFGPDFENFLGYRISGFLLQGTLVVIMGSSTHLVCVTVTLPSKFRTSSDLHLNLMMLMELVDCCHLKLHISFLLPVVMHQLFFSLIPFHSLALLAGDCSSEVFNEGMYRPQKNLTREIHESPTNLVI